MRKAALSCIIESLKATGSFSGIPLGFDGGSWGHGRFKKIDPHSENSGTLEKSSFIIRKIGYPLSLLGK
jgi:hypothetical protein